MQQVKDLMTKFVVTATVEQTVAELRRLITLHNIGALPILEKGEKSTVAGIVTDSDLRNVKDPSLQAKAVMSSVLHFISPNASAAAAAKLMLQYSIHHLLVKDKEELVGIISSMDLLTMVAGGRTNHYAQRMVFN